MEVWPLGAVLLLLNTLDSSDHSEYACHDAYAILPKS